MSDITALECTWCWPPKCKGHTKFCAVFWKSTKSDREKYNWIWLRLNPGHKIWLGFQSILKFGHWFLTSRKKNQYCLFVTSLHACSEDIEGKEVLTCTKAPRNLSVWTLGIAVFCFILLGMVSVSFRSERWERDYFLSSTFVSILHFHFYCTSSTAANCFIASLLRRQTQSPLEKRFIKYIPKLHISSCKSLLYYYIICWGNHNFS